MRYSILKPRTAVDPRHLVFSSSDDLYAQLPRVLDCESEDEAVTAVRSVFPDGIAMPVELKLGSGKVALLGVIASVREPHHAGTAIPFVMFVQPHAKTRLERESPFDRERWAVLPKKAELHHGVAPIYREVEFRSSGWETPVIMKLSISRTAEGRVLLAGAPLDIPFSIELDASEIDLR